MRKTPTFKDDYSEASRRYRNIRKLEEQEIEAVTDGASRDLETISLYDFCAVVLSALGFFATVPYCLTLFWSLSGRLAALVTNGLNSQRILADNPILWVSVPFLLVAAPMYTLVMPFQTRFGLRRVMMATNTNRLAFWIFAALVNYAALLLLIVAIHSVIGGASTPFQIALHIAVFLPGIPLSIAPILLFMFVAAWFLRGRIRVRHCSRSLLMAKLVELIVVIGHLPSVHEADNKKRSDICSMIRKVAFMIGHLSVIDQRIVGMSKAALHKMRGPASAFASLEGHILMPEQDAQQILTARLIRCFNLIASGNYAGLPVAQHGLTKGTKSTARQNTLNRALTGITLVLYLSLPIVLYVFCRHYLAISLDSDVKLAARLIYAVYAIVGMSLCLERMTGDTKELLFELAKRIIPGKG